MISCTLMLNCVRGPASRFSMMRLCPGNKLYEYVAWFQDQVLQVDDDQDYEWPGVIYVWAHDRESALAWGDELAKTCADTFVRSTAELWLSSGSSPDVVCSVGERLTAEQIGW